MILRSSSSGGVYCTLFYAALGSGLAWRTVPRCTEKYPPLLDSLTPGTTQPHDFGCISGISSVAFA